MSEPVNRFTKTVEYYLKYRPSYPHEIIPFLVKECGLTKDRIIADVGSGTGFLTKLFLDFGNTVYGVEPNQAMREAGKDYLKNYANFYSIDGSAETTTLSSQSIDIITAGTAFHWFDAEKSRIEFKRILKSPGWVVLIWNVRDIEHSSFMKDYEELINLYGTDFKSSKAKEFDKTALDSFFTPFEMKTAAFENSQHFDWEALQGRLLSTSYLPRPGDACFDKMLHALKNIYDRHQRKDKVIFLYKTKIYYGQLA